MFHLVERLRAWAGRRLPAHLRDARRGEDLAYYHLRQQGYRIVARNYRVRRGQGEIDLIGWDSGQLAFVEVKTRASGEHGHPGRAVGLDKRENLLRVAREYTRRSGARPEQVRFDIVSVLLDEKPPRVELRKDVFSHRFVLGRQTPPSW